MLSGSERRLRLDMDITVTRAADGRRAWTLTDLLGRPLGRITQARGPGFMIDPDKRAPLTMVEVPPGGRMHPWMMPGRRSRSTCTGLAATPLIRGEGRDLHGRPSDSTAG